MNSSNKFKFVWWGTPGCASRTTSMFFDWMGVDDLYNHHENFFNGQGGSFTHRHGIPEGCEDWPIVCNVRNPYSLIVSGYLDIKVDKKDLEYIDYLRNEYFNEGSLNRTDPFFLNAWKTIDREPDYIIHMETMEEDLRKLPFFDGYSEDKWDEALQLLRSNVYKNESPYDEYEGEFQKFQRFYNQEIADIVYSYMEPYFTKFGYDKDSWKS